MPITLSSYNLTVECTAVSVAHLLNIMKPSCSATYKSKFLERLARKRIRRIYNATLVSYIDNVIFSQALHQQQAKDYYILLLITDGILTDMDQTIHMIIGQF